MQVIVGLAIRRWCDGLNRWMDEDKLVHCDVRLECHVYLIIECIFSMSFLKKSHCESVVEPAK